MPTLFALALFQRRCRAVRSGSVASPCGSQIGLSLMVVGFVLMSAAAAFSQNSQFSFDASGNLRAQAVEINGLPQIIGQPQMQLVIPGHTAAFSVVVADTRGVSYQWLFNNSAISGATADSLLLTNVSSNNEGVYSVRISNLSGSVSSSAANLYIDSDGDGLPDSWELANFGNLNQTATGDADGDGVSNFQEFLDGTNPTNAASALYRITLFNDGGTVTIVPDLPAYAIGQVVTLTAIGSDAFPFHAWTGDVTTRSNSITVTMNANLTLFARFLPFTLTWTNTVAGNWNVAANWTPNLAPSTNESVVMIYPVTVTLNSDVNSLDLTLGAPTSGPELTGTGRLTISGTGTWSSGTMSGTGATIIAPGASFTIADSVYAVNLNNRTLENGGMALWSSGGIIDINNGIITNDAGAVFHILNSGYFNYQGGLPRFDNAGTFLTQSNATTAFYSTAFNNYGAINLAGGSLLSLGGGGAEVGTVTVPTGATINYASGTFNGSAGSSITGAGTLQVSGGTANLAGTVNVTGTNLFTGGTANLTGNYTCVGNTPLNIAGGTANFDGSGTVAPQVLNLNGILGGANTVTVGSAMNWTGGTMDGSGQTTIKPGATLTIAGFTGYGGVYMTTRTLENSGTVVWGGGNLGLNSCIITNDAGASFQIQNTAAFNYQGGSPRFDNAGTFLPAPAATTAFNGIPFDNYGAVNLVGGTFVLNGGNLCTSNSVVNYSIDGETPGTNFGQIQAPGTINVNGILNVSITNHFIPKTNDSFTLLSAGIRNGAFTRFNYSSNTVSLLLSNTPTSVIAQVTGVSQQTNAFPPPPGIISWWRAQNDATDSVGTNNGVLTNGVTFTTGEVGQSFLLDGIGGYVAIPDSPSLRPVSVTVEAWVKIFSTNGIQLVFAKPLGSGSFDSYGLALQNGAPLAAICDTNGFGTFISITNVLTLGQWYHLAYTYDQTSSQEVLYVNGVAVASANAGKSMSFDSQPLLLGADIENGVLSYFLDGQIDEASIYNRALGANEIASIYNVGSTGKQLLFANQLILHIQGITPTTARIYWSTNYPLYHLEYNTNLITTNWAASGLTSVVTGTNFVVTNSLFGTQMYYRLSQ
jgi:hypothetical protein